MTALSFTTNDGARLHIRRPMQDKGRSSAGGMLRGRKTGDAAMAPVVMLHSLFFNGSMFDEVVQHLGADAAFSSLDIYTPDHRGQGQSERGPIGYSALSVERLADDVIDMIETVVGEPVHLFGSSMGGYVALRILAQRPDLLASCVLSCCTAHAERQPERFAALESRIRTEGTSAMGQSLLETMFGERFVAENGEACEHWRQQFVSLDRSVADAVRGVFDRPGYEAFLPTIRIPLLLFSGALDRAKSPSDMDYIAERVPHSTHRIVADAGHTPPVESPAYVASELKRFWRQADPDMFRIERSERNAENKAGNNANAEE